MHGLPRNPPTLPVSKANGHRALRIRTILVPVDFSAASLKAVNYAADLAETLGAKLVLEHVIEPIPVVPDFAAYPTMGFQDGALSGARAKLKQLAQRHTRNPGLIEKTNVRQGIAFQEITRAASTLKADLIVIATHGYTGFKHVLLGSTAERVVRHAPCPVVVVPTRK